MGNTFCCEEPNNIATIIHSVSTDSNYIPISYVPKIKNQAVEARLQQIRESGDILYDKAKIAGTYIKQPHKQINKKYVYEGTWKDDVPQGKGNIIFDSGQYFQGQFTHGQADGQGIFIYNNGDYYEGNVFENKANGHGKYIGKKFQFQGIWLDSKPKTGRYKNKQTGTIITMNTQKQGKMKWTNGDEYQGGISNQNPDGYGVMYFFNKNKYEGNWRVGVFDGKGKYTWANGQQYSGQYQNGVKHGYGQFYYLNNRRYEGKWKYGKQNGQGRLFQNNNLLYQGEFRNGYPLYQSQTQSAERISYQNNSFYNRLNTEHKSTQK